MFPFTNLKSSVFFAAYSDVKAGKVCPRIAMKMTNIFHATDLLT